MNPSFTTSLRYLIALSILALITTPVSKAQPSNVVSIGDVVLDSGSNITVPITITNSTGIASVGLRLRYNPGVVNVTAATKGDFKSNPDFEGFFAFDNSNAANGVVMINTYISGTDLMGKIIVANVTLQAVGIIGSTSQLNLEISGTGIGISNQDGYTVPAAVHSGSFKIRTSIGYSALVSSGQNTYVQSLNTTFGTLITGQNKTIPDSVILNNTGDIAAKVEARFINSVNGVHGITSGDNVLNASNFALGIPGALVPLNNSGADVEVALASPGVTALDARLGAPVGQAAGDYSGIVILIFSNNI